MRSIRRVSISRGALHAALVTSTVLSVRPDWPFGALTHGDAASSAGAAMAAPTPSPSPSPSPGGPAPAPSPGPAPAPSPGPAPAPAPGPGGHSPSAGPGSIFNAVIQSFAPPDPAAAVESATAEAQNAISVCQQDDFKCLADALEAYATALRNLSPALPPELHKLPDILSKAALGVRAAKTKAEAANAIKAAIVEVHKTISLITADDALTRSVETREGALVAQTLEVARVKLVQASGL
jgi:hypothetical protein